MRVEVLRQLVIRVHGIDLDEGAVELAAFSLCLSLCDALEPEDIRASVKLFPRLDGVALHWELALVRICATCIHDAAKKSPPEAEPRIVTGASLPRLAIAPIADIFADIVLGLP